MLSWPSGSLKEVAHKRDSLTLASEIPCICFDSYVLKNEKADVYRLPYLSSGGPGFALLETAKKINFGDTLSQIAKGFSSGSWDKLILLAWGIADKYLPQSIAEEFKKQNPILLGQRK